MDTAKIFQNGQSQAVRLPKEYRFHDDEVGIRKVGEAVLLYPKNSAWESFVNAPTVSDDFSDGIAAGRAEGIAPQRDTP